MAVEVMVPQVGQGAVAVECASEAATHAGAAGRIDHGPTRRAVECERAFLAELGRVLAAGRRPRLVEADGGCAWTFLAGPAGSTKASTRARGRGVALGRRGRRLARRAVGA